MMRETAQRQPSIRQLHGDIACNLSTFTADVQFVSEPNWQQMLPKVMY